MKVAYGKYESDGTINFKLPVDLNLGAGHHTFLKVKKKLKNRFIFDDTKNLSLKNLFMPLIKCR